MPTTIVRSGDSLSRLVQNFNRANGANLTVNEVARANGIRNPDRIYAGQRLVFTDSFDPVRPPSARPSPSPSTVTDRSPTAVQGNLRAGGGYGGTELLARDAISFARDLGFSAGSQKRGTIIRNGRVLSGTRSDHHHAQRNAYAVDFPARGARGDALAAQLARRYGMPGNGAGTYEGRNIRIDGETYRVQLLWRVQGHYDHVHLGFRRVG